MNIILFCLVTFFVVNVYENNAALCGCKTLRPCYKMMLATLLDKDEAACIEDAVIGASTVTIFLKAINKYCDNVMNVRNYSMTYEGRHLYEVVLSKELSPMRTTKRDNPVIIIEAGQQGGTETVGLALYVMEQMVACEENDHFLTRVTWVILPNTNPDGQEYSRYSPVPWKKNMKPSEDQLSFGVDLTRNFDASWSSCNLVQSGFSPIYPGPSPESESETQFIKSVLLQYKNLAHVYISIKRDGHGIHYPYGYTKDPPRNSALLQKVAGEVAIRVNARVGGGVHLFDIRSLFQAEGDTHCGSSIDYAFNINIPLCYEMRVFHRADNKIMSKFQQLPPGYETSLRNGYFSGIKEFYNVLTNEKKYGKIKP